MMIDYDLQQDYDETIGILTYDMPHRKTYDTLCLLKAKGYKYINIYAMPLSYKKSYVPLIKHRPEIIMDIPHIKEISMNFEYNYLYGEINDFSIPRKELLLVCGAGILPDKFVNEHTIINAHPGYIPNCRGLDSYKWAIYENEPIGVTTHIVGKEIDSGLVIDRKKIDLFQYDTFHSVSQRMYEMEINMLVEALQKVKKNEYLGYVEPKDYIIHKRMPNEIEKSIFEIFEKRKRGCQ